MGSTWQAFTWSAVLRLSLTFRNFLTCSIVSRDEQRMYLRSSSLTGCSDWIESSLKQNNLSLSFSVDLFAFSPHWLTDWLIDWSIDQMIDRSIDWLIDQSIDWFISWLTDWLADWPADWLNGWLTDCLIVWLTAWLTDWGLTDWLIDRFIND